MVNNMETGLLPAIFPNSCALCGLQCQRSVPLCVACEGDMPINRSACSRCASPLPPHDNRHSVQHCGQCLQRPPPFDRAVVPWLYGEHLAHLIHRWKFQREVRLTGLLAFLWQQQAGSHAQVDLLIPVPLHWRRRWQRGFNQSELLARQLRRINPALRSTPIAEGLVKRHRATAAQASMNALHRTKNLAGAFTVREPCDKLHIAIIDDVFTTGATAAALAQALMQAGASYIEVWCLARTPARRRKHGLVDGAF